ncbi:MAG: hypothetical protein KKB50_14210 [Planctomycetes bacterium]|nr:hypothetical protein [Planctomycetota bacterium]
MGDNIEKQIREAMADALAEERRRQRRNDAIRQFQEQRGDVERREHSSRAFCWAMTNGRARREPASPAAKSIDLIVAELPRGPRKLWDLLKGR